MKVIRDRFFEFRKKHETRLEILFFIGGFIFDAWMVSAPDELFAVFQQVAYLFIIAALIHFELLHSLGKWNPPQALTKAWEYRNIALHFFLGTLLNIYSIFYIKSASLLNGLIFLLLMIGMILANELPVVKKSHVSFKVGLYAICVFSFFSVIYPIIFGFVGWTPFGFSLVTTLGWFFGQFKILSKTLDDKKFVFRTILTPALSVATVFAVFYVLGWIPPVPLSVREQGIYHLIEKRDGKFFLSTEKEWWKFWQQGDSEFRAEPGDKIYFYAQIYSPARISDQVVVHWYQEDAKKNWALQDMIPLRILGGREEGYRGWAFKSNYTPGKWKIVVETSSGLEISRLYFEVIPTEKTVFRNFVIEER